MRDKVLVALVLVFAIACLGVGYARAVTLGVGSTNHTTTVTQTSTVQNETAPFTLTLVISTDNTFNSSIGVQPAYYVVGPSGLVSSAKISLPAHRPIRLVIFNYDNGSATLVSPGYSEVNGTSGGTITYVNDTSLNSTQTAAGISIRGARTVSSVPSDDIAHTFTIPALGINIPVPVSSTVVATFTIDETGTFQWFCMTECGSGATGIGGAMLTPGWMTGAVTFS